MPNYILLSQEARKKQISVLQSVRFFLSDLQKEYPRHDEWYSKMADNFMRENTREIIICHDNSERILGVALLKKDIAERKICSLRVKREFQHQGIGRCLLVRSFEYLETEKPLITVSSGKNTQFIKLFTYFSFDLQAVYRDKYTIGDNELAYNGLLGEPRLLGENNKEINQLVYVPKNPLYGVAKPVIREYSSIPIYE